MGEKSKGQDKSKTKKPKALKVGNRPHEERERQAAALKPTIIEPGKALSADRS